MGKQHTKFTDKEEHLWTSGPFTLRCPSESSNILFVSVDRPSPISTPNFKFVFGKVEDILEAMISYVSNFTWELQPHFSTFLFNNVWSFQTPRKRWEWQLKAGTHIFQRGSANSWRSWVPVISKEENMEGRKDKCSSCSKHVFNDMSFNSHLFWGNIWKIISM